MPVITPGSKILVSGANGYAAAWLVQTLLEQGYAVRGTVRSEAKGTHLKELFKSYGDKFELVVVEDITREGAFDEAVKGVDAIEHTASPFHFNADDPQELISPAVNGTIGILKSAVMSAPNVKRVVILASAACVMRIADEPLTFTESDWNDQAIEEVERLGQNSSAGAKYRASKTLAEKAAWSFWREHQKEVNWDLVVLNPPFIFGPFIHQVASPAELNTSTKEFYNNVVAPGSSGKSNEALATNGSCYIDVRDLALALSKSLVIPEAGGERIIVSAGPFVFQDWLDVANSLSPSPIPSHAPGTAKALPVGNPGAGKGAPYKINYDTSKEQRILGLKYRSMEEVTRDTLADFERRGW
ncbi:hypothetical protein AX17_003846 [Amanita inopinata Kibby_2008]|nr:hypothetical protein AX17_003846 [Amanita inopinata Kibby_2008]